MNVSERLRKGIRFDADGRKQVGEAESSVKMTLSLALESES